MCGSKDAKHYHVLKFGSVPYHPTGTCRKTDYTVALHYSDRFSPKLHEKIKTGHIQLEEIKGKQIFDKCTQNFDDNRSLENSTPPLSQKPINGCLQVQLYGYHKPRQEFTSTHVLR
jgi:hypothetical protein